MKKLFYESCFLVKTLIARTYPAAHRGSGERDSPDGGWGNAPVLL